MFFAVDKYVSPRTLVRMGLEFIVLWGAAAAFLEAVYVAQGYSAPQVTLGSAAGALAASHVIFIYFFGLYSSSRYSPGKDMSIRAFKAAIGPMAMSLMLFNLYFTAEKLTAGAVFNGWLYDGSWALAVFSICVPIMLLIWRYIFLRWINFELPRKRALIIGSESLAKKIGEDIYGRAKDGLELIGFIDDDPSKLGKSIVNPGVIGGYGDIYDVARENHVDMIIVALNDRRSKLPMSALLECKMKGISVIEGETFQEKMISKIPLEQLKPSWLVFSEGFKSLRSKKLVKRSIDIVVSLVCFTVFAPVMALASILIRLESGGPVILRQQRVGENGKLFMMYKFRSMRQGAEDDTGPVWAMSNDGRVTRVGKIIRRTRLDELPQLINVIRGDMSFVGPRPERPYFVERLRNAVPYYDLRTAVKPGVTGWAQIKFRYGSSVNDAMEKLQYDLYYIKHMSPLFDLLIMLKTVKVVLGGDSMNESVKEAK